MPPHCLVHIYIHTPVPCNGESPRVEATNSGLQQNRRCCNRIRRWCENKDLVWRFLPVCLVSHLGLDERGRAASRCSCPYNHRNSIKFMTEGVGQHREEFRKRQGSNGRKICISASTKDERVFLKNDPKWKWNKKLTTNFSLPFHLLTSTAKRKAKAKKKKERKNLNSYPAKASSERRVIMSF